MCVCGEVCCVQCAVCSVLPVVCVNMRLCGASDWVWCRVRGCVWSMFRNVAGSWNTLGGIMRRDELEPSRSAEFLNAGL